MWRVYATSALRYPWTFVTPKVEAAAIWIPPGGTELTPEDANIERYRRVGFEPRAEVTMPAGQIVTTMWRPAR